MWLKPHHTMDKEGQHKRIVAKGMVQVRSTANSPGGCSSGEEWSTYYCRLHSNDNTFPAISVNILVAYSTANILLLGKIWRFARGTMAYLLTCLQQNGWDILPRQIHWWKVSTDDLTEEFQRLRVLRLSRCTFLSKETVPVPPPHIKKAITNRWWTIMLILCTQPTWLKILLNLKPATIKS